MADREARTAEQKAMTFRDPARRMVDLDQLLARIDEVLDQADPNGSAGHE